MARPKKVITIEEKIQKAEADIQIKEAELADAKNRLKELHEEKKKSDIERLYAAVGKSNLSIDDVLDLLNDK